jgi:hypothetical protein
MNGLVEGTQIDHRKVQDGSPSTVTPGRATGHEKKNVKSRRKRVRSLPSLLPDLPGDSEPASLRVPGPSG